MNIGIVTTWFERGAAYVSKQFENVWSEDHEVFIFARGGEEYAIGNSIWDKENVTWGKRNLFSTPTQINVEQLKEWVHTNSIQFILFNEQHEWEPVIACRELDVIIGAYVDYYKKETIPFFEIYDFLICNTNRHLSVFKWHPQAFYIPWGTDTNLFSPRENELNSHKVVFFHSCGMNPERKGTDILLKAFDLVNRNESTLIIHSQVNLMSFFPNKKSLITKFIEEGSLQIIQKTVSAPGLYHLGDVYVYPSRLEGIGLTIAEAISSGLPTIVTDEQPMNEFITSDKVGKLVKVESHTIRGDNYYWPQCIASFTDLAHQMNYYILNKSEIPHYKSDAREYALENLDWSKNLKKFNGDLQKIRKQLNIPIDIIDKALRFDKISFLTRIKKSLFYRKLRSKFKNFS
jgi:1,2-diacylglycerol 3-alpha-glucosyltransferase